MKTAIFLSAWFLAYCAAVFGFMCFVAWGIPNIAAWGTDGRALFGYVFILFACPWMIVGFGIAEAME